MTRAPTPRSLPAAFVLALACSLAALIALVGAGGAARAGGPTSSASGSTSGALGVSPSGVTRQAILPPGASEPDRGPSRVIYPPESINVRFHHQKHLALGQGLTCLSCHDGAASSRRASDRLLPAPATCDGCHKSDHKDLLRVVAGPAPLGACATCHEGYKPEQGNTVARTVVPTARLNFDHKAHADRRIGCESCHGAVQEVGLATREQLGRMRGCLGCHGMEGAGRGDARGECSTCHLQADSGLLKTSFAEGKLLPPRWLGNLEHTADFLHRHKMVALDNSPACAACHSEASCSDCHDGRVRPRNVHPNDYLSLHAFEARIDNPRCASCHQQQQFCVSCHQRSGVTQTGSPGSRLAQGRFHPPPQTWVDLPRTRQHHAWEAQRNLNACVSCHSERDCASCHATRGVGGRGFSPHPSGFAASCGRVAARNPRPCLVCHDPGDGVWGRCR
jgi:Cytochrome c7 and related cytochrome c